MKKRNLISGELCKTAKTAINILEKHGHSAYIVGGFVRDIVMCKKPYDYDICTSALPCEIKECFKNYSTIETGIIHGTVVVVMDNENIEITTFRKDGEYKNHRKPEKVSFVGDLEEDLSRRDFTINAMAYNEKTGIIDLFGGMIDIENKLIKTVGNPEKRFNEDGLRMLRALRFSSVLGFEIENETKSAIKKKCKLISCTAAERQNSEIKKLMLGENAKKAITENKELMFEIIPELEAMVFCEQNTKYHAYNVFEHTMKAFEYCPKNLAIRLAILLHDIGKPYTKTSDLNGQDHFKGHYSKSSEMANEILKRLCFDNKTIKYVCLLIENHGVDLLPKNEREILHFFRKFSPEVTIDIFTVMYCDLMGKSQYSIDREKVFMENLVENCKVLKEKNLSHKIADLKITGKDIISLGVKQGKEISVILEKLIIKVIDNEVENSKEDLLICTKTIMKKPFQN